MPINRETTRQVFRIQRRTMDHHRVISNHLFKMEEEISKIYSIFHTPRWKMKVDKEKYIRKHENNNWNKIFFK